MTFNANIDLGQIIIGSLIGIVGYFVKRTIDDFGKRIDRHEEILFRMSGEVQLILGMIDRRSLTRRFDDQIGDKKES